MSICLDLCKPPAIPYRWWEVRMRQIVDGLATTEGTLSAGTRGSLRAHTQATASASASAFAFAFAWTRSFVTARTYSHASASAFVPWAALSAPAPTPPTTSSAP